jgi:hypothetical protein
MLFELCFFLSYLICNDFNYLLWIQNFINFKQLLDLIQGFIYYLINYGVKIQFILQFDYEKLIFLIRISKTFIKLVVGFSSNFMDLCLIGEYYLKLG